VKPALLPARAGAALHPLLHPSVPIPQGTEHHPWCWPLWLTGGARCGPSLRTAPLEPLSIFAQMRRGKGLLILWRGRGRIRSTAGHIAAPPSSTPAVHKSVFPQRTAQEEMQKGCGRGSGRVVSGAPPHPPLMAPFTPALTSCSAHEGPGSAPGSSACPGEGGEGGGTRAAGRGAKRAIGLGAMHICRLSLPSLRAVPRPATVAGRPGRGHGILASLSSGLARHPPHAAWRRERGGAAALDPEGEREGLAEGLLNILAAQSRRASASADDLGDDQGRRDTDGHWIRRAGRTGSRAPRHTPRRWAACSWPLAAGGFQAGCWARVRAVALEMGARPPAPCERPAPCRRPASSKHQRCRGQRRSQNKPPRRPAPPGPAPQARPTTLWRVLHASPSAARRFGPYGELSAHHLGSKTAPKSQERTRRRRGRGAPACTSALAATVSQTSAAPGTVDRGYILAITPGETLDRPRRAPASKACCRASARRPCADAASSGSGRGGRPESHRQRYCHG
jgi:hypothetical protein